MSYRFMRLIVLYDVPMESLAQQHSYRQFRRLLLSLGFMMLQKSIYVKLLLNASAQQGIQEILRHNKPDFGLVYILSVTEKQFSRMELLCGERHSTLLNSTDRLVIL